MDIEDMDGIGRQLTMMTCTRTARFSDWQARRSVGGNYWLTVPPMSALGSADKRTAPFQMSQASAALLNDALEHLTTLHLLLSKVGLLPRVTPFTLIRGGIEAAASLYWMLQPRDARTRLARRFALWEQSEFYRTQAEKAAGITARRTDLRTDFEQAMKDFLGDDRITERLTRTKMLRDIDELLGDGSSALFYWQVCSGFAHAQPWATELFQEFERKGGTSTAGVSHYSVTGSWKTVAVCASVVHELIDASLRRLDFLTSNNGVRVNELAATYRGAVDSREFVSPEIIAEVYARHGVPMPSSEEDTA